MIKFKNAKFVFVYFDHNSTSSFRILCDQIIYKEGQFSRNLVFLKNGFEVGNCHFGLVDHFEYYESIFSSKTTYIDPYDVIGGDLVEA